MKSWPKAAFCAAVVFFLGTSAQAELFVSPLRAVLDDAHEQIEIEVRNPAERRIKIRASWLQLAATAQGGYRPLRPEEAQNAAASPYLKLSPQEVWIDPGETVGIQIERRLTEQSAARRERRSHLLVEALPGGSIIRKASVTDVPADIILGVSIPVVLRGDGAEVEARFANAEFARTDTGALELRTRLRHRGEASAYGDVEMYWRGVDETEGELVGRLGDIALYPDVQSRNLAIPVREGAYEAGEIRLVYQGRGEYRGRRFDEKKFVIRGGG